MNLFEQKSLVLRAFELAGSPSCQNMRAVKSALKAEGYTHNEIGSHLMGTSLRRQLKALQIQTGIAPPRIQTRATGITTQTTLPTCNEALKKL